MIHFTYKLLPMPVYSSSATDGTGVVYQWIGEQSIRFERVRTPWNL